MVKLIISILQKTRSENPFEAKDILKKLANFDRAAFLEAMCDVLASGRCAEDVKDVAREQLKKSLSIDNLPHQCCEALLKAIGYACEKNATRLQHVSNEIFDVIALTLSSNEENKDIRLVAYEALSAWLEHLKPTLGRHVKIDQLKEMLTKKPGDDEDIVTVKLKCSLSIPYGNVSSKRRYSTDGNDLDARTSRSNSWSPDTLRKPPTPRDFSGQSPSDLSISFENGIHALSCPKSAASIMARHADMNDIIHGSLTSINVPSKLEPSGLSRDDGKQPDGLTLVPWERGQSPVSIRLQTVMCIKHRRNQVLQQSSHKIGSIIYTHTSNRKTINLLLSQWRLSDHGQEIH